MKILSGDFKGRNIIIPTGIRPVSLRVRKSCFDILGQEILNTRVLDLFSGSGSLGIEALSRGAKEAFFIDSNLKCISAIEKNIALFKLDNKVKIYLKNSLDAVKNFRDSGAVFDIIFLDPPYHKGILRNALQLLEGYDILANSGYIAAFCYIKDDFVKESDKFSLIVNKKYGQTIFLVYRKT